MEQKKVTVTYAAGQNINGLGQMIGQYLEQNLDEFEDKVRQALKLRIASSVEMEKGIATTVKFDRDNITIQNGVSEDTHMHLKSSYATFADVLSGKLSPFKGVANGQIKLVKVPLSKPFQAMSLLRFLKIPDELLVSAPEARSPIITRERFLIFMAGMGCGAAVAYWVM